MARHPAAVARLWRDRASTTPSGYAAAVLDSLRALRDRLRWPLRRVRLESFGAIVQLAVPRALVFVDRAMALIEMPDAAPLFGPGSRAEVPIAASLARAHCHTHWSSGRSPTARSGFPGSRDAA